MLQPQLGMVEYHCSVTEAKEGPCLEEVGTSSDRGTHCRQQDLYPQTTER